MPGLTGKVMIVTGGNSGLGYESVKAFALKGAEVILASRSAERGEQARREIINEVADHVSNEVPGDVSNGVQEDPAWGKILVMQLDLGDLESVRQFAGEFKSRFDRLDVLMNNAGIMMTPYFKTKEGFEGQLGTNHLGHFALTGLLMEVLLETPGSRIVTVSSGAHRNGDMDFENLQFENGRGYPRSRAYGRSKLANLLFTYELQRKLESEGKPTMAVAAHPGIASTNLARHLVPNWMVRLLFPLFGFMMQEKAMGALPQIRASVDPKVQGGEYYGPGGKREWKGFPVRVRSSEASHNLQDAARLWEVSEKLTGVNFDL